MHIYDLSLGQFLNFSMSVSTCQIRTVNVKPNWSNQTIWTGDNLPILRGMNSESVDLIYLDPPFNSKANYAAPIGSKAAGAAFKDTWTLSEVDAEWINLIEAKHSALYPRVAGSDDQQRQVLSRIHGGLGCWNCAAC